GGGRREFIGSYARDRTLRARSVEIDLLEMLTPLLRARPHSRFVRQTGRIDGRRRHRLRALNCGNGLIDGVRKFDDRCDLQAVLAEKGFEDRDRGSIYQRGGSELSFQSLQIIEARIENNENLAGVQKAVSGRQRRDLFRRQRVTIVNGQAERIRGFRTAARRQMVGGEEFVVDGTAG